MNCEEIQNILNELKVDSIGRIRGRGRAIDKIHSAHLTKIDSILMGIRVKVARMSTGLSQQEILKELDEYLYKMQVK